jgi:hypothetical protein
MNNARMAFAGILAGLVILFTPTAAGAVAPVKSAGKAVASVCLTGSRADAEYRRKCMRYGTRADGVRMWFDMGRRERVTVCASARRMGLRTAVRESVYDVAYDTFHNHNTVIGGAILAARFDCRYMIRRG